jgi:hypothetical protein
MYLFVRRLCWTLSIVQDMFDVPNSSGVDSIPVLHVTCHTYTFILYYC